MQTPKCAQSGVAHAGTWRMNWRVSLISTGYRLTVRGRRVDEGISRIHDSSELPRMAPTNHSVAPSQKTPGKLAQNRPPVSCLRRQKLTTVWYAEKPCLKCWLRHP